MPRVAELLDADGHARGRRRLIAVGAEQAIPPGQVEAEVAVRLARSDRVVDAVHVGRDDEPAQRAVDQRQAHVAVVEHRGGVEQHLEDQHGNRRRAERDDHGQLDHHREQDLDGVEAQPGGDVEVEIGVMHAVQPPQQRHGMEQHVLQVDGEVEQDDRDRDGDPGRQRRGR